jgi:hypothetical protein
MSEEYFIFVLLREFNLNREDARAGRQSSRLCAFAVKYRDSIIDRYIKRGFKPMAFAAFHAQCAS